MSTLRPGPNGPLRQVTNFSAMSQSLQKPLPSGVTQKTTVSTEQKPDCPRTLDTRLTNNRTIKGNDSRTPIINEERGGKLEGYV